MEKKIVRIFDNYQKGRASFSDVILALMEIEDDRYTPGDTKKLYIDSMTIADIYRKLSQGEVIAFSDKPLIEYK